MANYSLWNVRRRHEWLATPLKKKRIKGRGAKRIGLWNAWRRKKIAVDAPPEEAAEKPAEGD